MKKTANLFGGFIFCSYLCSVRKKQTKQMIMEPFTAKQARQLAENCINKIFVKNNVDYILDIIKEEANKGEFHTYISKSDISGKMTAEKMTIEQIQKLGYEVCLCCGTYKITW